MNLLHVLPDASNLDRRERNTLARRPRLIGPELYHHVYAWGNDKHPIFKANTHYEKYLEYLELYGSRYDIDIIAYGLMNWHIHLFVFDWLGRLSQFMNCLHGRYAQFFNKETERVGHVFGERFNNRIVQGDSYALWLSRYIHRQAVEACLVADPRSYQWTSYREYIGLAPKGFLKPGVILDQFGRGKAAGRRYEALVISQENGPIDWNGTTASIIGNDEFIESIGVLKRKNLPDKMNIKDLMETVSRQLGVSSRLLLNPRGRAERKIRHKVFLILVDTYCLSAAEVARAFGVAPNTGINVLRK